MFLLVVMAGWIHRKQLNEIDDVREENRVLREQLGRRRLRLTDLQRRRLIASAGRPAPAGWPAPQAGARGARQGGALAGGTPQAGALQRGNRPLP